MLLTGEKQVENLVVDTTAFIQNAQIQNIGKNIYTVQEVVSEITNKRQLRRLCVLPYDLIVKDVFPENVQAITEFTKKTGDYPSLSATDIKVMALTYQLEKQQVGIEHLRENPIVQKKIVTDEKQPDINAADVSGFYMPGEKKIAELEEQLDNLSCKTEDNIANKNINQENEQDDEESESEEDSDDEDSWITPSNLAKAKKQMNSELMEEKSVKVACMTTDFAMQNVLKQMNLNVAALDGRMIKQLRTFILRCYTCFGTTSIMTKQFCPKCGNNTLKRVAVSLDENGKQQIHINARRPLTGRGKRFSIPTIKGGKHSNNPVLVEDQPMPDQRSSRLARMKNNPMEDDYIAGFSPFVMRDVNSKSAQLCIRPGNEVKHWMRKNPNEARRTRKK